MIMATHDVFYPLSDFRYEHRDIVHRVVAARRDQVNTLCEMLILVPEVKAHAWSDKPVDCITCLANARG